MRLLHIGIVLSLVTAGFADTVRLKNGRSVEGTYLGGSARQVRVEVGDQIRSIDVGEIDRIECGGPAAPPAPAEAENRPVLRRNDRPENVMRPEATPPPPPQVARTSMDLP